MKAIALDKRLIERSIEKATELAFDAAYYGRATEEVGLFCYDAEGIIVISDRAERGPLLIILLDQLILLGDLDPRIETEALRLFLRGLVSSAWKIWNLERNLGQDFDKDGQFHRRPWDIRSPLAYQTAAFFSQNSKDEIATTVGEQDLILFAFGNFQYSDQLLRQKHQASAIVAYRQFRKTIDAIKHGSPIVRRGDSRVFSLVTCPQPASLSYDQWLKKLDGTTQYRFITSDIAHPLRIDGPAGSGKTLSLVLKCLYTLKKARAQKQPHHAAFIVFSEETKHRIQNSFFAPLDEDEFYLKRREDTEYSVKITTLFEWSREDLKSVADPYSLSHDDPAVVRRDQRDFIEDLIRSTLPNWHARAGHTLSPELRNFFDRPTETLRAMLQHEFGVVIKGMADSDLEDYLKVQRPKIGLPILTVDDRRFVFTLFTQYQEVLNSFGIADLDDVAISHIKLLQMPLRRKTREAHAFDSVFIDEAHSFNPNELSIFFLLTRRSALPPLVISVDLPQGVGDKGYDEGKIEDYLLSDPALRQRANIERYVFDESFRCSAAIMNLASAIFTQGHTFFQSIRLPAFLKSGQVVESGFKPLAYGFPGCEAMMTSILQVAEELALQVSCRRNEILIVFLNEDLFKEMPRSLIAASRVIQGKVDPQDERTARKSNQFLIARPHYVHGLEYEGVLIVGATEGVFPRIKAGAQGAGASAVFATQEAVDLLYLSLTRARQQVVILYDTKHTFLLDTAVKEGALVNEERTGA